MSNESVAPSGKHFDLAGLIGGVSQALAKAVHRGVEAVIEIDECPPFPKLLLKFFARDDLHNDSALVSSPSRIAGNHRDQGLRQSRTKPVCLDDEGRTSLRRPQV